MLSLPAAHIIYHFQSSSIVRICFKK